MQAAGGTRRSRRRKRDANTVKASGAEVIENPDEPVSKIQREKRCKGNHSSSWTSPLKRNCVRAIVSDEAAGTIPETRRPDGNDQTVEPVAVDVSCVTASHKHHSGICVLCKKGADVPQSPEGSSQTVEPEAVKVPCKIDEDDDDDLPSVISPSPSQDRKHLKKYEVVWVNYKKAYWPCLITAVYRSYVNFKFINESRRKSHTFRSSLKYVKRFDDPELNVKLLNEGKDKYPEIVNAYNRVVQYYCHLLKQQNLSALKFLTHDNVGDLLYGICPEADPGSGDEDESSSLTDASKVHEKSDSDKEDSLTDAETEESAPMEHSFSGTENCQKPPEYLNRLLFCIESDNCLNLLERIYVKSVPSERMDMFLKKDELKLMWKSGLGPFSCADVSQTDKLLDILGSHLEKLKTSQPDLENQDCSLFLRHVMLPEAVVFALQEYFNSSRDEAEIRFEHWEEMKLETKEHANK